MNSVFYDRLCSNSGIDSLNLSLLPIIAKLCYCNAFYIGLPLKKGEKSSQQNLNICASNTSFLFLK